MLWIIESWEGEVESIYGLEVYLVVFEFLRVDVNIMFIIFVLYYVLMVIILVRLMFLI